ncbi:hypothetical protein ACQ4LE_007104 [Meloidogyne hapla]
MEEKKLVYRVKLTKLPKYMAYQDINKFLKNNLGNIYFCKLKYDGKKAYFTCSSEADAIESVKLLDNAKFKNMRVNAEIVVDNAVVEFKRAKVFEVKTASEMVTPLANLPYEEQLEIKFKSSRDVMLYILKQLNNANVFDVFCDNVLQKVLPAPLITAYRNKCEFTIGYSKSKQQSKQEKAIKALEEQLDEEDQNIITKVVTNPSFSPIKIIVGFINGKMMNRSYSVLPIEECQNLSLNTINVVKHFQEFVREFDERPFNEFLRKGFWKMLTVKDFLGDCMLIVTVNPHNDLKISSKIKQKLVEKFLPKNPENLLPDCNITSIFWQEQENSSDDKVYEHLAGPPFVYESLLGCTFRISASTFFQTNSTGAALLYSTIGDLLKLPKLINVPGSGKFSRMEKSKNNALSEEDEEKIDNIDIDKSKDNEEEKEECEAKKPRLDEEIGKELTTTPQKQNGSNVFLDICCGSGSIAICLMARVRQSINEGTISDYSKVPYGCVGIDLNIEAIRDARRNASENGFDDKSCKFLCGQAESVFKDLKYYMPTGCSIQDANIMGILDPPRAGIPDKAIIGCRKLLQLKTLIYVSCDPRAATKNFVDLCRPMSCKFDGQPFKIVAIQPVDLFPMTKHLEWIVKFER